MTDKQNDVVDAFGDQMLTPEMEVLLGEPNRYRHFKNDNTWDFTFRGMPFSAEATVRETLLFHSIEAARDDETSADGIVVYAYTMAQVRNALKKATEQ